MARYRDPIAVMETTEIRTPGGLAFTADIDGPAGGDLVLLLHGFPESRHSWREALPELARAGYRAVAPDQRGYSPGARPDPGDLSNYSFDKLVQDAVALADAMGRAAGKRFHLVGHDWALYALRILVVFALADISLRYVELPIRRGYFELWFRGMKYRTKNVRLRQRAIALLSTVLVLSATTAFAITGLERADQKARAEAQAAVSVAESDGVVTASTTPGLWVTGDSVILGIRNVLAKYQKIELINARVGRQIGELIQVVKTDKPYVSDSPVVFNLGNNNRLVEKDVVELMDLVKDQPQIVVVNTAVPRPWRDSNNELIQSIVTRYSNTKIVDWNSISKNHPEYFASDGVHLNPPGVNAYVSAILEVLTK